MSSRKTNFRNKSQGRQRYINKSKEEGIPKLRYGQNNNFIKYRKAISTKALMDFGDLGKMIMMEEYYEPPPVKVPDLSKYNPKEIDEEEEIDIISNDDELKEAELEVEGSGEDDNNNPNDTTVDNNQKKSNKCPSEYWTEELQWEYESVKADYNMATKARRDNIIKMQQDRPKLFGLIMSTLSTDSEDALRLEDEYDEYIVSNDPLQLWLAVVRTHKAGTVAMNSHVQKAEIRAQYNQIQQYAYENIVTFKERFDSKRLAYESAAEIILDSSDVAMDFLKALDNQRYAEFKANLFNGITLGNMRAPNSVTEIYRMLQQYMVPTNRSAGSKVHATVFTTIDSIGGKLKREDGNNSHRYKDKSNGGDKHKTKQYSGYKNKTKKDLSKVKCYECGELGHYAYNCPIRSDKDEESDREYNDSYRKGKCALLRAQQVRKAFIAKGGIPKEGLVILDNGADISAVVTALLYNVRKGAKECKVSTLSGEEMSLNLVGELKDFFTCYSSTELDISVLSFAQVEDHFDISYHKQKAMVVHMPERDLVFKRVDGLFVADMSEWIVNRKVMSTFGIMNGENKYTKRELAGVELAKELVENAGHVSERDAVQLVKGSNVDGVNVTVDDVHRYFDIYGKSPEYVKGRMVNKRVSQTQIDSQLRLRFRGEQDLYCDVLYVGKRIFLISLATPVGLLMTTALLSTKSDEIGLALQEHINIIEAHKHTVRNAYFDPQKGVSSLRGKIRGASIDETGAGDHMPLLDAKIRRLKETMRSIQAGLPWKECPETFVNDLVAYATARHNGRPSSCNGTGVAPRVALTGRRPKYKREYSIKFGDYCETKDPQAKSNDIFANRSDPCIALYPVGNAVGSWVFYNLNTRKRVRRTQWTRMATNKLICEKIDNLCNDEKLKTTPKEKSRIVQKEAIADAERLRTNDENDTSLIDDVSTAQSKNNNEIEKTSNELITESDESAMNANENVMNDVVVLPTDDNNSVHAQTLSDDPEEEMETDSNVIANDNNISEESDSNLNDIPFIPRRSGRDRKRPSRYALHTTLHVSMKKGMEMFGMSAKEAVVNELKQLIEEKKALTPVQWDEINENKSKKRIRSLLLLKPKYDAMGEFEKIKARLVANGAQQDKKLYEDVSSPTAAMQNIMMCIAIAAKEKRKISVIDIKGAYLNAEMTEENMFMELDEEVAAIVGEMSPDLKKFIDKKGKMTVRLDKALYGCVQSAKLWHETLAKYLRKLGFSANDVEPCVFNKMVKGKQLTTVLFVDDILATCEDEGAITEFIGQLKEEYDDITHNNGENLSYLGMHLSVKEKSIKLSQEVYVKTLLEECKVTGVATSPAGAKLFEVSSNAKELTAKEKEKFHATVAKLLYLAKRTRNDILLAVSFLTTRVKCPTNEDQGKLVRVLKYLNKKPSEVLTLGGRSELRLRAHVDAAFGCHRDAKSHTGFLLKLGGSTVLCKSSKQKIVSKDSTEAELVALSDMCIEVMKAQEFLEGQLKRVRKPLIYQDNMSTMTLVKSNRNMKFRNKHMRVRRALVYERQQEQEFDVVFRPTGQMLADVLTKPLQGALYQSMTQAMQSNYHRHVTGVCWELGDLSKR